jgi:integrase
MARLTKRFIDSLTPKGADYFEWDDEIAGFGVRVWPSGKKVYMAQYRADGRSRRVKLGAHGVVTVEEARKAAKISLGDVARGGNPAEDKRTQRKSMTVRQLCESYIKAYEKGQIMGKGGQTKKASTWRSDHSRIHRHILPLLGNRLVRDLTQVDITKLMRDVLAGKTAMVEKTAKKHGKAIVKGGPGAATRTVGLLGGILTYAVSEGVIPFNPAIGVKRPKDRRRTARFSDSDYQALGRELARGRDEGERDELIACIRLLAFTGCRRSEIELLKPGEIDEPNQCFRMDTKEGHSVRPIGEPALKVLRELRGRNGNPYVLPSIKGTRPIGGLTGGWKRIMKRAGLNGRGFTPHTLRHSFASIADELGFTESTIGALIGHSSHTTTGRYIHKLDSVLLAAADRVAKTIEGYMTSEKPPAVVVIRSGRRWKGMPA